MKRRILSALLPVLALVILFGMSCLQNKAGFTVAKISSHLPYCSEWDTPLPPDPLLFDVILNQRYLFLAGGVQSYAFVSDDGQYVIKFLKMKHLVAKNWLQYIPLPALLDKYQLQKIEKKRQRLFETFASIKIAYQNLPAETGVLYVHLNRTAYLHRKLMVIDQNGKEHSIDLDSTVFFVQRRAELIYERMARLLRAGNAWGAIRAQEAVLDLIRHRCLKGFSDRDGGVRNNYGFVGDVPMQIDVGGLYVDEQIRDPYQIAKELKRVEEKIRAWREEEFPK